jgi:hypothetical protein
MSRGREIDPRNPREMAADDETHDRKGYLFGFSREQTLLVGIPLFLNIVVVANNYGRSMYYGIPSWLVAVTPSDVLVAVTVGVLIAIAIIYLPLNLTVIFENRFRALPDALGQILSRRPDPVLTVGLLSSVVMFSWGSTSLMENIDYHVLKKGLWRAVVLPTETCVIIGKFGENYIATDYISRFKNDGIFTVYSVDNIPPFQMREPRFFDSKAKTGTSCPSPKS